MVTPRTWVACFLAIAWLSGAALQAQASMKAAEKFDIPPADAAIMKALDSRLKISFRGTPMKEILEYVEAKSGGNSFSSWTK